VNKKKGRRHRMFRVLSAEPPPVIKKTFDSTYKQNALRLFFTEHL
jgi:hypothetical protein